LSRRIGRKSGVREFVWRALRSHHWGGPQGKGKGKGKGKAEGEAPPLWPAGAPKGKGDGAPPPPPGKGKAEAPPPPPPPPPPPGAAGGGSREVLCEEEGRAGEGKGRVAERGEVILTRSCILHRWCSTLKNRVA
jgi:hypothetical protein